MGHPGHQAHGATRPLIVHGHAVGEGVAQRVVGLTVVTADLLLPPAGLLRTRHTFD